ncbi:hypothetical protein Tco_0132382 [Tanacetum coccineum]
MNDSRSCDQLAQDLARENNNECSSREEEEEEEGEQQSGDDYSEEEECIIIAETGAVQHGIAPSHGLAAAPAASCHSKAASEAYLRRDHVAAHEFFQRLNKNEAANASFLHARGHWIPHNYVLHSAPVDFESLNLVLLMSELHLQPLLPLSSSKQHTATLIRQWPKQTWLLPQLPPW